MKILFKEPGKAARTMVIPNKDNLRLLQQLVDGYIETVTMTIWADGGPKQVVTICDEEGRLKDRPNNVTFLGVPYCGNIMICGVDETGEDLADLPISEEKAHQMWPKLWEVQ